MGEYRDIPIEKLHLNPANPRCFATSTEDEAIAELLVEQGLANSNKLVRLAESIAAKGLDPSQNVVVSPREDGDYTVMEGNRRVAAIKLSLNPALVPDDIPGLSSRFMAFSGAMPTVVRRCYVTSDQAEVFDIISNRHSGQQGGSGTIPWSSEQRTRFEEIRSGKPDKTLALIEQIVSHFGINSNEARWVAGTRKTTLERVMSTPYVRERVGVSLSGGAYSYSGTRDQALSELLSELCGCSVGVVYSSDDRKQLIDDILERIEVQTRLDVAGQKAESPSAAGAESLTSRTPSAPVPIGSVTTGDSLDRPLGHALARRSIIERNHTLQTDGEPRIARLHLELKKLDAAEFPSAACLLLRTFVQLCVERYLEHEGVEFDRTTRLASEIRKACDRLKKTDPMVCQSDVDSFLKFADAQDSDMVTRTFLDACAHSRSWVEPSLEAMQRAWNGISGPIDRMMFACK